MDFLGPIFTRVAMRDLRFLDPRDQRGASAFGRSRDGEDEESPEWGTGGASEGGRGAGQTLGMDGGDLRKKWMVDVEWLNASTGFKMV